MLLSIVMMVRNEEKYLDKTLFALNDLRKDINVELIILDTGSTDNTVEIAKKYTDKVYFEKWNDNFADMRNKSIAYASGDWILILDADEKLTNYDRLKEFFYSNIKDEYNSATIKLKNILDEKEEKYNISSYLRLFKNIEGFGYEGSIHEQPRYIGPVYNDIALFDHYGYIFTDEELRQKKINRNERLLLDEINKKPNDPYINYQLGKNYMSDSKPSEAVLYLERAFDIYKKEGNIPLFVIGSLLNLYVGLKSYIKCENLCMKYIKYDKKNIDVYYYLAISQKNLGKYKESLKNYERYLYLLDNYDLSTQANNMQCNLNTEQYKEISKTSIIEIYYKLEMYDEIVKKIDDLSENEIKNIYYIIFESLYKLNLEETILELYNKINIYNYAKNDFKLHIEKFLISVNEDDKPKVYRLLSNIDDNYGILNNLRLGKKLSLLEYNNILVNEDEFYYGEVLYFALEEGFKIEDILENVTYEKVEKYTDYLVITKRIFILKLYKYLVSLRNTLNTKKLSIYFSLSKSLIKHGNLKNDKYEKLFLLYIKYGYDFIKNIYNKDLSDEEILNILKDRDDIFIFKINMLQKNKNKDKLKYIHDMKKLLNIYREYKDGIKILINRFENELNESDELKLLKKQYKSIVENSIQLGNLDDAISMIKEYETIISQDADLLNMKGIIAMHNGEFEDAELLFKESSILEINYNTMFNIAYLKDLIGEVDEARRFYNKITNESQDEIIVLDARERLNLLN